MTMQDFVWAVNEFLKLNIDKSQLTLNISEKELYELIMQDFLGAAKGFDVDKSRATFAGIPIRIIDAGWFIEDPSGNQIRR